MDGIFFDTATIRGHLEWGMEIEERDLQTHVHLTSYTKNLWRDHVLGNNNLKGKKIIRVNSP